MPYKIFKTPDGFEVFKHDAQGNKVGKRLGLHPTRIRAMRQLAALYASENKK